MCFPDWWKYSLLLAHEKKIATCDLDLLLAFQSHKVTSRINEMNKWTTKIERRILKDKKKQEGWSRLQTAISFLAR